MRRGIGLAAALALSASAGFAVGDRLVLPDGPAVIRAVVPSPPSVLIPPAERRNRKLRQRMKARNERRRVAAVAAKERARARARKTSRRERTEAEIFIARLTNWQRNQWARGGYRPAAIVEMIAARKALIAAGIIEPDRRVA